ncbi:MAG: TlpA family protein disulfide reductase [Bacteroidia bacterium]|nr:TlpA family protein disulfide reductase [Bacteroidia bacterium]
MKGTLVLSGFLMLTCISWAQHADVNKQQQQMQQTAMAMGGLVVGKPAPAFEFADANGKKYALKDFKGKVVYLDAWASWCGPCRQQFPAAKTLEEKYKGKDIVFLAVSIDANEAAWRKCLTDFLPAGIQLLAKGDNGKFATAYNLTTIPRYILIDKKGMVVSADAKRPSMGVETDLDALLVK